VEYINIQIRWYHGSYTLSSFVEDGGVFLLKKKAGAIRK